MFQGKFAEADLLYAQAIEIEENALGPDHPSLAVSLNNQAVSLRAQVNALAMLPQVSLGEGELKQHSWCWVCSLLNKQAGRCWCGCR